MKTDPKIDWITIHRKIIKWQWFQKSEMVHLFLYLILMANYDDGEWQGIKIKRGQVITGRNLLHKNTGISAQTIRTCLTRLKSTNEIAIQSTNKYSLITIIKYDDYQLDNRKSTNKKEKNQQTTNQQLTTSNKIRNKEDQEAASANAEPPADIFVYREWLECLKKSPRRDIRLIGDYLREKGAVLNSKQQAEQELRRNLKPAKDLTAWPAEAIRATIKWLNDQGLSWTMETIARNVAVYGSYRGREDEWPTDM